MMKENIGDVDKFVRVISGIAALGAGFYFQSWWGGAIGMILLGSAAIGWCPPYAILGFSTCSAEK